MNNSVWQIFDTGVRTAKENMQIDAELLDRLDPNSAPILHFYDWKGDSATYGYFVNPSDFLDIGAVDRKGLNLARRSTGGGIVFHIWDFAFSVIVPSRHALFSENTLENYAFVNQAVLGAVGEFFVKRPKLELIPQDLKALDSSCTRFCMAQPTKYDVVLEGRKIAGSAQRKTKKGFLHQGTIALSMPDEDYLKELILPKTKVLEAIKTHTFPLIGQDDDLEEGRLSLKQYLKKHITMDAAYVTER